jgi:Trk-type K+ transport system membrane component
MRKETYCFLLDHPRRCFTLLFPSSATWWLVGVLSILNFSDLFFFLILDLGNNYIDSIPVGYRILDGLFQVSFPRFRRLTVGGFHSDDGSVNCQFAID